MIRNKFSCLILFSTSFLQSIASQLLAEAYQRNLIIEASLLIREVSLLAYSGTCSVAEPANTANIHGQT